MSDPAGALWNALHGGATPIVLVYFPDWGAREATAAAVASFAAPGWEVQRVRTVEAALDHRGGLVLLLPDDEVSAVDALDGLRDAFQDWEVPLVLFLMRAGDGARRLAGSVSLAGWIRGNDVDPDEAAALDPEAERAAFEAQTGETVEEHLRRVRAGEVPGGAAAVARRFRAMLLERA